jgi:hypothetical protein
MLHVATDSTSDLFPFHLHVYMGVAPVGFTGKE